MSSYSIASGRQKEILRGLGAKAGGRTDIKLPLSEVAPTLDLIMFSGGTKFVDKADPKYEGGSDLAYDFQTLADKGFIQQTYLDHSVGRSGGDNYSNPGVVVTHLGFQADSSLPPHLEFWDEDSGQVLANIKCPDGDLIPAAGDYLDVPFQGGGVVPVEVKSRQFYFAAEGPLVRIRIDCQVGR